MQSSFIDHRSSRIHFSWSGEGDHALVCFHGYGESEYSYHFLAAHLPAQYKLIAIDMPYHGKTEWREGMNFEVSDLLTIVDSIRSALNVMNGHCTLIGYSMGGRVALSFYQERAAGVDKLILLAPDGLKLNFWYWLSTQTIIGNKIFAATIHNPSWFMGMLRLLNRLKLVNQSVYKFVDYFLHDKAKRKQLYLRWTCLRKLRPGLSTIKKLVVMNDIRVHLVYGRHDRIILPVRGERFRRGIEPYCTIELIESGHQLLQEKNYHTIVKHLVS